MNLEIYSDGSATVKTKPGGYAWVLVIDGVKHSEGSGYMELASNNDAELEAAIQGLAAAFKLLTSPQFNMTRSFNRNDENSITLVSDSEIVLNWASGHYKFKQENKIHKYEQLIGLMTRLHAKTRWVEGHTGDEHNERCDQLANAARKRNAIEKPKKTKSKESRKFRWDERDESAVVTHQDAMSPKLWVLQATFDHKFHPETLAAMAEVMLELIELEEARK